MNRETLIGKLRADLSTGKVVTIVGTGVTVAASANQKIEGFSVATWTGLLEHGVKQCLESGVADAVDADILAREIASGKVNYLVMAAETISQKLRARHPGTFRAWLKETVGRLRVEDPSILEALAALPGVLATLNYDNLIEAATGRHAVTWVETEAVQDVLMGVDKDAVLHLHGWYRQPETVVFGYDSYVAVRDHLHSAAVLQLFTIDRILLFVGCGDTLHDPNFARLIEWGREAIENVSPRHYLLCRSGELNEFRESIISAPWLQPLDYGAEYGDLGPFLSALSDHGAASTAVPVLPSRPGFDMEAYQQTIRRQFGRVKLEDIDAATNDSRPVQLTSVFTEQSVRECAEFIPRIYELPKELQQRLREGNDIDSGDTDDETLVELRRAYVGQSAYAVGDLVRDRALSRLVLIGDPGSGKSTILHYLLLRWAETALPDLLLNPMPLLVELREFAAFPEASNAGGILKYLHNSAGVRWHFDAAQLDGWMRTSDCLVLFDGLDEVFDPTLRRGVSAAIQSFAEEYPRARTVVTSRIIGFQHHAWQDKGFRSYMIQELNDFQIRDFITRWHSAADDEIHGKEAKHHRFERAITDSLAIRQLAGNPLLLTMMAILNNTQDLPRDRAELYEQCARLLLHQWKLDPAYAADPELDKASLDFKDKRNLLVRVARAFQTSEGGLAGNLIDEDVLERALEAGFAGIADVRPARAARALVQQLRGRNFMLCSVGGRYYAFVHRTFLEYFSALEIREQFQFTQTLSLEQLKSSVYVHWADESWHEVLCLLSGMLAPRFVAELLSYLLAQPENDVIGSAVTLAARCVGEVRSRSELGDVATEVLRRTKGLLRFAPSTFGERGDRDERLLSVHRRRAVHLVASVWPGADDTRQWLRAVADTDGDSDVRADAVHELTIGWNASPELLAWLKSLVQRDESTSVRVRALREIVQGWKASQETLHWVSALAKSTEAAPIRKAAVSVLAREWRSHPETLPTLKSLMQGDRDSSVCCRVIQELGRGWPDDPEILPWLKNHAQSDEDSDIREVSVEELARGWRADPDTVPILRNCAFHDVNSGVRQRAIVGLARGWQDDVGIRLAMKSLAQSDPSPTVRAVVLMELARVCSGDLETSAWLKDRARFDGNSRVRETAAHALARGWRSDPKTLEWLKVRAREDHGWALRRGAQEALAAGWSADPEILPILTENVISKSNVHSSVRASAVRAVARGWKGKPETLRWLKELAEFDSHLGVRQTAVRELARGWRSDSEVVTFLLTLAQSDRDPVVRRQVVALLTGHLSSDPETLTRLKAAACDAPTSQFGESVVRGVARARKHDSNTLQWLKQVAESGVDSCVRRAAIEEVVRSWGDMPTTVPWLAYLVKNARTVAELRFILTGLDVNVGIDKETPRSLRYLAASDRGAAVRCCALEALARGWPDDPDTLAFLRERAECDRMKRVRVAAALAVHARWGRNPEIAAWLRAHDAGDASSR